MLKKIIQRYQARFGMHGGDKVGETFKEELKYEAGRLYITVFISVVVWLPYIPTDLQIHQHPALAVGIRLGLSLLSVCLILLRFTKTFHRKPTGLLKVMVGYYYIATSLVTATSGAHITSYIGGYVLIIMVLMVAPLSDRFKNCFSILSIALFLATGYFTGLNFGDPHVRYSITDLTVAIVVSMVLNSIQNNIRYRTWEQRHELGKMVVQHEENLKTISDLAQKADIANKSKSVFLATMSHEIRTPMNAIIGIAQILLNRSDLPKDCVSALDKIHSSGNSLLGITNDILDMSKIESGKLELNTAEYDVPSLINDTVQLNATRIGAKDIRLSVDAEPDLPSKLIGDELRLRQILNNLLSNAIKYTEKGHVKLKVKHSALGNNALLRFDIEDSGQGMTKEDLEQLFSEYTRFNARTNRATEGTGLGLSITKRLVEMMGGKIEARSAYGKGSTFTVEVVQKTKPQCGPIGPDVSEKLSSFTFTSERRERRQAARNTMPYGKVLVVDDVETNLFVAQGLLAPYELEIETAFSGFAAIDLINSGKRYDIIFMDHMMPKMDGIETTQKIRELGYKGAIVALTANALAGNEEMFMENGLDGYIPKPIDVRHLDAVLNKFVRGAHPEEAAAIAAADRRNRRKDDNPQDNSAAPRNIPPNLIRIFCRDAVKAIAALNETVENNDIKLFTTTAHAMKSALATVGEANMSKTAFELEKAGLSGDTEYIRSNTGGFITALKNLVETLNPAKETGNADENAGTGTEEDTEEGTELLRKQLTIAKTACDNYDDAALYAAIDKLNEKWWKPQTEEALKNIRECVYLHSNFEGAGELVLKGFKSLWDNEKP